MYRIFPLDKRTYLIKEHNYGLEGLNRIRVKFIAEYITLFARKVKEVKHGIWILITVIVETIILW